jgi:hypothetical protein
MIERSIRFIEAIFGPIGADAAIPADAVVAAEHRLGFALPGALRELYLRTGSSEAIHASHNTIVPLDRLDFADDHLIFYEENQGVVSWGIARTRVSEDDPPVDQGQPPAGHAGWAFYPEFDSVSHFACAQAAWQAIQGGLPFVGAREGDGRGPRVDTGSMTKALGSPALTTPGLTAWLVEGGVAVATEGDFVGLATREAKEFLSASARLGLTLEQWSYSTLRHG